MKSSDRLPESSSEINSSHSVFQHGYAIVRIDLPINQGEPRNSIAVAKVFSTRKAAVDEALRLNNVNQNKGCIYDVYTTRLIQ